VFFFIKKEEEFFGQNDYGNTLSVDDESECSRCHSEEEEVGSISTKDSLFVYFTNVDNDNLSFTLDDTILNDQSFNLEAEMKTKVSEFMQTRSNEERD